MTPSGGSGMVFNIKRGDDIFLHFNPRFEDNCVVRNSYIGGSWEEEERYGEFPFRPNEHYSAAIILQEEGYEIAINGYSFASYEHHPVTGTATIEVYPYPDRGIQVC